MQLYTPSLLFIDATFFPVLHFIPTLIALALGMYLNIMIIYIFVSILSLLIYILHLLGSPEIRTLIDTDSKLQPDQVEL